MNKTILAIACATTATSTMAANTTAAPAFAAFAAASAASAAAFAASAADVATPIAVADSTDTGTEQTLGTATVQGSSRARRTYDAVNTTYIGQQELFRAACCNLGESFVTNPSVDVAYDDAATGASQIKLLGLSGLYVQMLTESQPAFRGAAQPFALGYVPGTWMKSINVSKGAASVKYGYESITGQIDIDYLKPDAEHKVNVDLYGDSHTAFEVNGAANFHLNERLSTNVLVHAQNQWGDHDGNHDGFMDTPMVRQFNVSNRWKYKSPRYIMHVGLHAIDEQRHSGQIEGATSSLLPPASSLFKVHIPTQRIEAYMKHAFILDPSHGTNIAFMANSSWHHLTADYGNHTATQNENNFGLRHYDVEQRNVNAQLMFETNFNERHALSTGLSLLYDGYDEECYEQLNGVSALHADHPVVVRHHLLPAVGYPSDDFQRWENSETVPGAYVQYTYTLGRKLSVMAGLRYDYNSAYESGFVTPRMHLRWSPSEYVTFRAATGLGYRSTHPLAENYNLLASGRQFVILPDAGAANLALEKACNSGVSAAFSIPVGPRLLKLNAEYYYTYFLQQTVVDYEHTPGAIVIHNLRDANADYAASAFDAPKSYSHVFQVDAQYEFFPGFDVTAAYRHNLVRCTYGNISSAALPIGEGGIGSPLGGYALREKLLTPRFKALLSICYQTPLKLWQFDVTLAVNGGGRLPDGTIAQYGLTADGHGPASVYSNSTGDFFRPYETLSAQVTRRFRHVDVYLGGENLTNRRQLAPILGAGSPFDAYGNISSSFEPTLVYAPVKGWMVNGGLRLKF